MADTTADQPVKLYKTDEEWRRTLTPQQYQVTRGHGTERPFTGPHLGEKRQGLFHCVCCSAPLFRSDTKFESGSGWPSFFEPISADAVTEHEDRSLSMRRIEVRCGTCDAHLGHVFPDGPQPTNLRYCVNGVALDFEPDADKPG